MTHPEYPRTSAVPSAAPPVPVGLPATAAAPPRRAFAPDLARGLMLCLIAIANVSVYLWGTQAATSLSGHPASGSLLDRVLSVLTILFVDGSIYPMFAFLFGYGIVQFSRNRAAVGDDPRTITAMLLRRNLWLVVFGVLHAALLFGGDILGAYGLCGLILGYLIQRAGDRALMITLWVLLGILGLLLLAQVGMILLAQALAGDTTDEPMFGDDAGSFTTLLLTQGTGETNYLLAVGVRLLVWLLATVLGTLSLTVPLVIITGGLAARHRWIELCGQDAGSPRRPRLGLVAGVGIPLGVLGNLPQALAYLGWVPSDSATVEITTVLTPVTGACAGLGYAALFGLLGLRVQERPPRLLLPIAYLGKRSLTFYLFQSLVFAPLLAAWGFGLGRTWNTTPAFLLAIGVWIASLALATWMESRNRKGPAEVVLRRLTYGREGRG
ncbi:DUF418 domain-containing protein [Brevibacterium ammoniilyticum]|uniref:DUF418 domain-containing protein n=1 Tax=Brevibacterium ammoniilyticum TaxID=1046555 RepID=A0ABP9U2Z7_9MICO